MSLRLLSALDEIAAIDRVHLTFVGSLQYVDSSAISTGVAVLLSAVTTSVRASVQTGDDPRGVTPANLAREGDPIGLTAAVGGFARPNHGLTTVVTGQGLRYLVEISENSLLIRARRPPSNERPGEVRQPTSLLERVAPSARFPRARDGRFGIDSAVRT